MNRALAALGSAFAYFSTLPVGAFARTAPGNDALVALPLVGAVIGACAGGAGFALERLGAPRALDVALVFGLLVVLSGAIHVDGFLDACDALFAPVTPERRLEILKDPRHGTFAVAGMAVATVAWCAALESLASDLGVRFILAVAAAGALGRLAAVANVYRLPYARAQAPQTLADRPPILAFALAALASLALASAFGALGVVVACVTVAGGLGLGIFSARRLGGLTGDAYGFIAVCAEVGALVAIAWLVRAGRA